MIIWAICGSGLAIAKRAGAQQSFEIPVVLTHLLNLLESLLLVPIPVLRLSFKLIILQVLYLILFHAKVHFLAVVEVLPHGVPFHLFGEVVLDLLSDVLPD